VNLKVNLIKQLFVGILTIIMLRTELDSQNNLNYVLNLSNL